MTTPDGFSDNPLCAEMERRCAEMILVSQAVMTCADVFEQACEPRPPKAEWFEKWHCWWVWVIDASDGPPGLIFTDGNVYTEWEDVYDDDSRSYQGVNGTQDGCGYSWRIDKIAKCLPVKAENWQDYPAPIGWKVVGE